MTTKKLRAVCYFVLLVSLLLSQTRLAQASDGITLDINGSSTLGWAFEEVSGWRSNGSSYHLGDDTNALDWNFGSGNEDEGKVLLSVASGTVIFTRTGLGRVGSSSQINYGNQVILQLDDDPRFAVRYAHLNSVAVSLGQHVNFGAPIGTLGSSGLTGTSPYNAHLHLVLYKNIDQHPSTSEGCLSGRETKTGLDWLREGRTPCRLSGGSTKFSAQYSLNPNLRSIVAEPVDVFLLVDLSGSFTDDLPVFKSQAPTIISTLKSTKTNIRFGLAKYEDYPIPPFGDSSFGDKAYERLVDLTFDTNLVLNTISGLFTRSGGDGPQSQLPALYQAATGAGQDLSGVGWPGASIPAGQQANFRDGAEKIFLLWTDAPFHRPGDPGSIPYPGPSFDETAAAIQALDPPKVIGISSGGVGVSDLQAIAAATNSFAPAGGVDCNADGTIDIAEGEPLVCSISSSGVGIAEAVVATVDAAAKPVLTTVEIDIKPGSDPNSINCKNTKQVIPVAILTTDAFDALTVDHKTVRFEGASETHKVLGEPQRHEKDVDGDGDLDLIFHFRLSDSDLTCDYLDGTLIGSTFDGLSIIGSDDIRMIGGEDVQPYPGED